MKSAAIRASRYNGGVNLDLGDFQLRDFQPPDFDSLWDIDQNCFPPGISYSRTELRTYMRRRGSFTLIAFGDARVAKPNSDKGGVGKRLSPSQPALSKSNAIVGFIVAEGARGKGHIITIDVVANVRRFGVGSLLLEGAEARLRTLGCSVVVLETAVDNLSALSFYKRHGYSVVQTFPRYYSNGVDALVLQKILAPGLAPPEK